MQCSNAGSSTNTKTLPTKRIRPPKLSLGIDERPGTTSPVIDIFSSPTDFLGNTDERDDLLSSSSSSSSPLTTETGSDVPSDDLLQDLAKLEQLRRNVHKNLRLRPLRTSNSQQFDHTPPSQPLSPPSDIFYDFAQQPSPSPSSSINSDAPSPSVYYTPTTELSSSPRSARFLGPGPSPSFDAVEPPPNPTPPRTPSPRPAQGLDPSLVFQRIVGPTRPLLIDTRQAPSYLASRIQHSVNIAIPSLIMRRCRKPGGGFSSLDALRTYITTDRGMDAWDELLGQSGVWDGDVILYDERMNEKDRDNPQSLAWALLPLIAPLLKGGSVDYLKGGISAARLHRDADQRIIPGERDTAGDLSWESRVEDHSSPRKAGLFQLDTHSAGRPKAVPELDTLSLSPGLPPVNMLRDNSPSPSPSCSVFPPLAQPRKASIPNLRRLETTSAERLIPKLSVRTVPIKSNTLALPLHPKSSSSSLRSNSPSYLQLSHSSHQPGSARLLSSSANSSTECLSPSVPYFRSSSPHTPWTPTGLPPSPATARPELDQPLTTEEALSAFSISTILPNFLFLGPELTMPEHVQELQALGVKRIMNIAHECDDDQGLNLRGTFERYTRIPMRDNVEEENVETSVREVCNVLDDARLHSAPTYVHCKAGKSRSVTAVIAYLIHANHWTLSRAYAFVLERRRGISPNIGFVSELMTFEEQELGGKSVGVVNPASAVGSGDGDERENGKGSNFGYMSSARRTGHLRESLPPAFQAQNSEMMISGQLSAGGLGTSAARVGDAGQEMEIKDASGRYRHARRAPVDEATLQPMRRVSKAGLESSSYSSIEV